MIEPTKYEVQSYNLNGLKGISDKSLEMHFTLYNGYVSQTNSLMDQINEFIKDEHINQEEKPAYSELTRRLGFEYNGMVLHEYYFENVTKVGLGDPDQSSRFRKTVELGFGDYEVWEC